MDDLLITVELTPIFCAVHLLTIPLQLPNTKISTIMWCTLLALQTYIYISCL